MNWDIIKDIIIVVILPVIGFFVLRSFNHETRITVLEKFHDGLKKSIEETKAELKSDIKQVQLETSKQTDLIIDILREVKKS